MVEATKLGLENESDLSPEREERRALGPWGTWRNPEPEKSLSYAWGTMSAGLLRLGGAPGSTAAR